MKRSLKGELENLCLAISFIGGLPLATNQHKLDAAELTEGIQNYTYDDCDDTLKDMRELAQRASATTPDGVGERGLDFVYGRLGEIIDQEKDRQAKENDDDK